MAEKPQLNRPLLVALAIVFSFVASTVWSVAFVQNGVEYIRINLSTMLVIMSSIILGPWIGAFVGASRDILTFFYLHSDDLVSYLPGITAIYTLHGFLSWFIFTKIRKKYSLFTALAITVAVVQFGLSGIALSFELSYSYGIDLIQLLRERFIVQIFTVPIYIVIMYFLFYMYNVVHSKEDEFKEFASQSEVGICLSDRVENIYYVNDKFIEIFGYTLEDIPDVEEWYKRAYPDPDYRDLVRRTWTEMLENTHTLGVMFKPMVHPVVCKNGDVKIIEFHHAVYKSGNNMITFVDLGEGFIYVKDDQ